MPQPRGSLCGAAVHLKQKLEGQICWRQKGRSCWLQFALWPPDSTVLLMTVTATSLNCAPRVTPWKAGVVRKAQIWGGSSVLSCWHTWYTIKTWQIIMKIDVTVLIELLQSIQRLELHELLEQVVSHFPLLKALAWSSLSPSYLLLCIGTK